MDVCEHISHTKNSKSQKNDLRKSIVIRERIQCILNEREYDHINQGALSDFQRCLIFHSTTPSVDENKSRLFDE